MERCTDILKVYRDDFYATKFDLNSEYVGALEQQFISNEFARPSSVHRKVACLHVYHRLYHLDPETLSLMRVFDDIRKEFQPGTEIVCSPDDRAAVLETVTQSMYGTLLGLIQDSNQYSIDKIEDILSQYREVVSLNYCKCKL